MFPKLAIMHYEQCNAMFENLHCFDSKWRHCIV